MAFAFRIIRETNDLLSSPPLGYICRPKADPFSDDVEVVLHGPEDTPYEGRSFKLELTFPEQYPLIPPSVKFITPIYHPNVDIKGNLCLTWMTEWTPVLRVAQFLHYIRLKIIKPEIDNALQPAIAFEYTHQKEIFDQKAKKWTLDYGIVFNTMDELDFHDPVSVYEEEDKKLAASSSKSSSDNNNN